MKKAKEKKWLPSPYIAQIKHRAPDKWDAFHKHPFFDTWAEAHAFVVKCAEDRLAKAKSSLKSAERSLKKAKAMTAPAHPDTLPDGGK